MGAESDLLRRIQEALGSADLDLEPMIAEAWESAQAEVRAVLQRAFQHELLDRAVRALEEPAPADRRTVGNDRAEPEASPAGPDLRTVEPGLRTAESGGPSAAQDPYPPDATYLFGITRAEVTLDPDLPTIGEGPVRGICEGDLQAVVCDADPRALNAIAERGTEDLELLAQAAYAHEEVLARVAAQACVLPLRLGTLLRDDHTIAALLSANGTALRAELDRLDGHAEWAVVVRLLEAEGSDRPEAGHGRDGAPATDRPAGERYLRERQEALAARERRAERRTAFTTSLHERLTDLAVQADLVERRPLEQTAPAMHGVYLLRWETIESFESAIGEVRAEHPEAMIEVTGPLPPYHFTAVDLSSDGGQAG